MAFDVEQTRGDRYEVPRSRGVPPTVRWLIGIGLFIIFVMGVISVAEAGHFHVWPAGDTTRTPLSGKF